MVIPGFTAAEELNRAGNLKSYAQNETDHRKIAKNLLVAIMPQDLSTHNR